MKRIPEPELMEDTVQAAAYANADFDEPHTLFIDKFREVAPTGDITGTVLDLGCGPADISVRIARAFPACRIHALDGATAMLEQAQARITREQMEDRIHLFHGSIPDYRLPMAGYDFIISNSLLHHLHNPGYLWHYVKRYSRTDTFSVIMDLRRPDNTQKARELVKTYSAAEPEILQRDFYNSLCAAFTPEEVEEQLSLHRLDQMQVTTLSDRHLIAYGWVG